MQPSLIPNTRFNGAKDAMRSDLPKLYWTINVQDKMRWELKGTSFEHDGKHVSGIYSLHEMPEKFLLTGNLLQEGAGALEITSAELFSAISKQYDFSKSFHLKNESDKPNIGFTVVGGSQRGGGTTQLYRYANWLSDLGFDVTIYSNDAEVPAWANLRCRYIGIADDMTRYSMIDAEVLIVYSILELPAVLQLRGPKVKRILHLCQGVEEFHLGGTFAQLSSHKEVFKFLHALPVGRIVVSKALERYFLENYQQQSFLVTNGIDPLFFNEQPSTCIDLKDSPIVKILQVGNPGDRVKGGVWLLEAVSLLAEHYSQKNFSVTFVSGPKVIDPFFTAQLPPNVSYHIKEQCSLEQMLKEYQDHHIVVNSSYSEGFGLSTIEAMAAGTSVVVAQHLGIREMVIHDVHALTVPLDDVMALSVALATIIENPTLGKRLRESGRILASSYTIQRQFDEFIASFSALLSINLPAESLSHIKQTLPIPSPISLSISVTEPECFSVLVPVYNHDKYLGEALDTLRAQTYPHWEAVVVNDGSTDRTPEVMQQYAALDSRFRLFHQENGGTAAALNTSLLHARNPWICWLSSDDFFKHDKLETHARYIEAYPEIKFFHSDYSVFMHEERTERPSCAAPARTSNSPKLQTLKFFASNYVHGNTIAIHREIFNKVGTFDRNYPSAQDFDMWLRMSRVAQFYYINKVTCTTRIHSSTGTFQFPEAGIFDSQRSLIALLNTYSFRELFPFLRFDSEVEVTSLLRFATLLLAQPSCFLYKGVLQQQSPFLDRLNEWLSTLPVTLLDSCIRPCIGELLPLVANLPTGYIEQLSWVLRPSSNTVSYVRRDAIRQYFNTLEYALQTQNTALAHTIYRYLMKLERQKVVGAIPITSILPPHLIESMPLRP